MNFSDFFFDQIIMSSVGELLIGLVVVLVISFVAFTQLGRFFNRRLVIVSTVFAALLTVMLLEFIAFQFRQDVSGGYNGTVAPAFRERRDIAHEQTVARYNAAISEFREAQQYDRLCNFYTSYHAYLSSRQMNDEIFILVNQWIEDVQTAPVETCKARAYALRADHNVKINDYTAALNDIKLAGSIDVVENYTSFNSMLHLMRAEIFTKKGDNAAMRQSFDALNRLADEFPAYGEDFPEVLGVIAQNYAEYKYYLHRQFSDYEIEFGDTGQAFHHLALASGFAGHHQALDLLVAKNGLELVMADGGSRAAINELLALIENNPYDILYENQLNDGHHHPLDLLNAYQKMGEQELAHNNLDAARTIFSLVFDGYQKSYQGRLERFEDLTAQGTQNESFINSEKQFVLDAVHQFMTAAITLANIEQKLGNISRANELNTQIDMLRSRYNL
ncbi:hypothetical protein [Pseudemcibacter aquimaris]|uniref:hypothetical protein n=1 Tax=Pseudemcibacter aquimaris TaxID=2857064 RepID=UPI002010DA35|nr:hypothetical protein [Pseudemcibacter aquimaris]MCC3861173.1 hypothetical protein [Pseudemcibacter aquimaris]WDU57948.1 hypothetical protein KW060_12180 [Pseudemcibacter aquimaris]